MFGLKVFQASNLTSSEIKIPFIQENKNCNRRYYRLFDINKTAEASVGTKQKVTSTHFPPYFEL